MKIFNRFLHPICILAVACLLPAAATADTGYDRLVVLGGSLSDPGDASVLTGMSVAPEKVSPSQTDNVFSSALFPGFARPDRHNLTTGIADSRRGAGTCCRGGGSHGVSPRFRPGRQLRE